MNKTNIAYGWDEKEYYEFDENGIKKCSRNSCIAYSYEWSDLKELRIDKKQLVLEFTDGKVFTIRKNFRTPGVLNRIANLADPHRTFRGPCRPQKDAPLGFIAIMYAVLIGFGFYACFMDYSLEEVLDALLWHFFG